MRRLMLNLCAGVIVGVFVMEAKAYDLLSQDWESGIGNWWVDNGLWEVGKPTAGPLLARSGQNCAGTALDGNYPSHASTRLVSSYIALPAIAADERITLKFWYWLLMSESTYYGDDLSWVQISVRGGPWITLAGPISGYSPVWTQGCVDLSAYADSTVRVAFLFTSNGIVEDSGLYVDDISLSVGPPVFNRREDFEAGIGDWSADNGLWEMGAPTVGPPSAHSGQTCFGTVLHGNYTSDANTRLISPYITLIPENGDFVELYFWQWFRINVSPFYGNDSGWIQVCVDGGSWQTVAGPISGYSDVWSQGYVDLSAYAHSTVRIAFYFVSNGIVEDGGWYIDDIRLNNVAVPVLVQDLTVQSGPGTSYLSWRVAPIGNDGLIGVHVQRASDSAGPFTNRTEVPLEPREKMFFADEVDTDVAYWYRLVLLQRDGEYTVVGPVQSLCESSRQELGLDVFTTPGNQDPIRVRYTIERPDTFVELAIHDIRGRRLFAWRNGRRDPGTYLVTWDPAAVPNGVYIARLQADAASIARKFVIVR